MKKSTKMWIKQKIAVILIVLMSIESFGAVVSSHDGEAFVTKKEFEDLQANFNEQIDRYNLSLDSKIDGKIADYVNGLKIEKRQDLERLLDENGVYGKGEKKWKLYWNSKTDKRWMTDANRYAVQTINCQILAYDPDGPADYYFWGGNYNWDNLYGTTENVELDPAAVANLVYVYEDDGVTFKENQIYYEKVNNYIKWQYYFQFYANRGNSYDARSYRNPDGGSINYEHRNVVNDNAADFNQQNLKNWPMTYLRMYTRNTSLWDVWKQCYVTITQVESEHNNLLLCPFSTASEYIWDKNDASTLLGYRGGNRLAIKHHNGDPLYVPPGGYQPVQLATAYQLRLESYNYWWFPWQTLTDTVALKERKIKNLIDISDKNKAAENGVVLGTVPEQNGDITIYVKVRADAPGNVYVYIGDDSIKNWKDADFKGKKVSITSSTDSKLIEYEYVKKNQIVWVLYEPNSTLTDNYKLYVDDFYYMAI